jgi:hypothetical protein
MVMTKTSSDSQIVDSFRLYCLSKRLFFISLYAILTAVSQFAIAESTVTPTFQIKQVLVDNEFDDFSETGQITQISPGVIIDFNGARSDLSLIYSFDAIRAHSLEQDDREFHQLLMDYELRHKPEWTSYARAVNRLTNGDIDGTQSRTPEFIDNNSDELFTFDTGTTYSERISRDLRYSTSLQLDYADQENSQSSTGQGVALTVDNEISENILTWNALFQSRAAQSGDDDDRVDLLGVNFKYKYDQTLDGYLDLATIQTDDDEFDENRVVAGITWKPTRQTFLSAGMGRLGDDRTYDFDARILRPNSLYSARYSEKIEAIRDQLFDQQDDQFGQSTQTSTSITAVLVKRGDLAATFYGLRSTLTFSLFHEEETRDDRDSQRKTGAEVQFDRRLSPRSNITLSALAQENKFEETGDLYDYSASYQKKTSENAEFEVFVTYETYDSTDNTNDYDQSLVGAAYRIAF